MFIRNHFALAVALLPFRLRAGVIKHKSPTPEKSCVNCKTTHRTGRPFCSADCCREYKENGNVSRANRTEQTL
jgi:hypothetical protein